MNIKLPKEVEKAINMLYKAGFNAYVVGGCVRDCLLGISPLDWDITTCATPDQIKKIFADLRIIETGIKHGTVTVIINSMPLEITTFRIDGKYTDNRHPEKVEFTSDIYEDLSRRDFTVNALAYNYNDGIIDCFGGINDLNNKIIRCVREPNERFNEDALRIMRALRFASVLGFEIEEKTAQSILKSRNLLSNIAVERIQKELIKLLCGKNAKNILLEYSSVIFVIIKELEPLYGLRQNNDYHIYDAWEHTVESVKSISPVPHLRMAMLLHDIGKYECATVDSKGCSHFLGHPIVSEKLANKILHSLKFSNKFIDDVLVLIKHHDNWIYNHPDKLNKWLGILGEEHLRDLLKVLRADIMAQAPKFNDRLTLVDECEEKLDKLLSSPICVQISDLALNGNDIINLGIPKGKAVGQALTVLLNEVLDGNIQNKKDELIKEVKKFI